MTRPSTAMTTVSAGPVAAATDAAAVEVGAGFGSHLDEAVAVVLMQASLILRRGHTSQAHSDAAAAGATTAPAELDRLAGCGWLAAAAVAANPRTSPTTLGWIVSYALSWLDSAAAAADPVSVAGDSVAAASALAAAAANPVSVARDSVDAAGAVAVASDSDCGPDAYTSWLSLTAAEALERTRRLSDAAAPAVDAALAEAAAIAVDWGEMRPDEIDTVIAAADGMFAANSEHAVVMLVDTRDAVAGTAAAGSYAIPTDPAATAVEAAAATDPAELDRLARSGDWSTRASVAANAHTSTDTLHHLAELALVVATNADGYPFPLLASDPQMITDILAAIAANPRTSAATLSIFAHPGDEEALCENLDRMCASAGVDFADPDRDAKERRLWKQWQQLQDRYLDTLADRTAAAA